MTKTVTDTPVSPTPFSKPISAEKTAILGAIN